MKKIKKMKKGRKEENKGKKGRKEEEEKKEGKKFKIEPLWIYAMKLFFRSMMCLVPSHQRQS